MSPSTLSSLKDSYISTSCPDRWHSMAAHSPPNPAPTIITFIPVFDLACESRVERPTPLVATPASSPIASKYEIVRTMLLHSRKGNKPNLLNAGPLKLNAWWRTRLSRMVWEGNMPALKRGTDCRRCAGQFRAAAQLLPTSPIDDNHEELREPCHSSLSHRWLAI
jgi:hypothetical protein